jgi:hypothetical protein
MADVFTPIETVIADLRRSGKQPRNLRLLYDMPEPDPAARKFKPGDLVKIKDDVEDYAGKVGMVIEDDGSNDWPYSVQMQGVATPDIFNEIDLDHWSPSSN